MVVNDEMAPKKETKTFILENASGKQIGKYSSKTPGSAAKKAATAGHTNIILRETGGTTKRVYTGSVKKLTLPKTVKIAGRDITINKESKAKFVKTVKN